MEYYVILVWNIHDGKWGLSWLFREGVNDCDNERHTTDSDS